MKITVTPDAGADGFANLLRRLKGLAFRIETDLLSVDYEGILVDVDTVDGPTATFADWDRADQDYTGPRFTLDLDDPTLVLTYL